MENKKVKGATKCHYDGIDFESELEKDSYILLQKEGFSPQYTPRTFDVFEGKKFSVPFYSVFFDKKLKRKVWGKNRYKVRNIGYTPDFILYVTDTSGNEVMVIIEVKGYPNETYMYRKKLFQLLLEEQYPNSVFFETRNLKQLKAAIEVIKTIKQ